MNAAMMMGSIRFSRTPVNLPRNAASFSQGSVSNTTQRSNLMWEFNLWAYWSDQHNPSRKINLQWKMKVPTALFYTTAGNVW